MHIYYIYIYIYIIQQIKPTLMDQKEHIIEKMYWKKEWETDLKPYFDSIAEKHGPTTTDGYPDFDI